MSRDLRHSPLVVLVGSMAGGLLTLGSMPLWLRLLGPEARGLSASVISGTYLIAGLCLPGARQRIGEFAGTSLGADWLATAHWLTIRITLALCLLLGAARLVGLADRIPIGVLIALAVSPLSLLWILDFTALAGRGQHQRAAGLLLIGPAVQALGSVACWVRGSASASDAVLVHVVAYGALAALVGGYLTGVRPRRQVPVGDFVRRCRPLALGGASDVVMRTSDRVIVLWAIGAHGTGVYTAATSIQPMTMPLAQALGGDESRRVAQAGGSDAAILRAVRQTIVISLLATVGYILLVPPAISVLAGSKYPGVALVALAAAPGFGALAYNTMWVWHSRSPLLHRWQVAAQVASIAIMCALGFGGAFNGPVQAAAGLSAAYMSQALILLVGILQTHRLSPTAVVPRPSDCADALFSRTRGDRL